MKTSRLITLLLVGILVCSAITWTVIVSGLDWSWAVFFNQHNVYVKLSSPFVLAGMGVPLFIIGYQYFKMKKRNDENSRVQYWRALGAFVSTYILMTVLKVFTNRVDMEPFEPLGSIDFSHQFRFGFMNSNSWWESFSEGWPSGHTMIAVGMAIAIHPLLRSKFWRTVNVIYPIIVAMSVSTAFHWISDVVSGGILGVILGYYFALYKPKG